MIIPTIWFIIGLIALIGGAEILVRAVTRLATAIGISKLIIGLTVVAFGTSAPELAISIQAGINGQTDLMLGNIIGSNISNTLLILGLVAVLIPLKVNKWLIKSDLPIMIGITVIVFFFSLNGMITFWECLILSGLLITYLIYLARQGNHSSEIAEVKPKRKATSIMLYLFFCVVGFILLITGAQWMIDSALIFAERMGVSELVIGLTVVAIGTSLPEVVVVLVAAIKKERDIAVGSVIGSNILNLLAVLGVSGLFIQGSIPVQEILTRFDIPLLIIVSILCIPIFYTGYRIARWEGAIFLFFYGSYLYYLYLSGTQHPYVEHFSYWMTRWIIPVLIIVIIIVTIFEWKKRYRFRNFKPDNS